jgi:glycosyltransferase involved in cell wall biosynthesis
LKVLHVTPSFYPATGYGGPVYSGYSLCNALVEHCGIDLSVLTTDSNGPNGDRFEVGAFPTRLPGGYDVYYCRRWFGKDIAPGLFWRLWSMIRRADVVHLTAVYSPPTIPTLALCKLLGKPVVWSLRGALQRWAGTTKPRTKQMFESICAGLCEPDRVVLHVTSEAEKQDSSELIKTASAIVAPNGIDAPTANIDRSYQTGNDLRVLYLGRLHPIKGIENLLQAMMLLHRGITLSICGDGELKYRNKLEKLSRELGLNCRVRFYGHVGNEDKQKQFMNADLCVVPSFSENFGIVVAEALAAGVPVIASTNTPWAELNSVGCGLWVENSYESLAKAIDDLRDAPLAEMGQRGREWMARKFSWNEVAEQIATVYATLSARRQPAHSLESKIQNT